jgi:hypothetical protein
MIKYRMIVSDPKTDHYIHFTQEEFAQMITIFNGMLPDDKAFHRIVCAVATDQQIYFPFLDSDKMRALAVKNMLTRQ